jgi:hypothetical protein
MVATHSIRQQTLQVELLGTESQALALQSRLSAYCRDWLNPALEQLFDQLLPENKYLRIEHLELELGRLPPEQWEQQLAPAIVEHLRQAVLACTTDALTVPGNAVTSAATAVTLAIDPAQRLFESWLYFLDSGLLPWSFKLPSGQSLQSALAAAWSQGPILSAVQRRKLQQTLDNPLAMQRLLLQFNAETLFSLLQQLAPELFAALAAIIAQNTGPTLESTPASSATRPGQASDSAQSFAISLLLQQPSASAIIASLLRCWQTKAANLDVDWQTELNQLFNSYELKLGLDQTATTQLPTIRKSARHAAKEPQPAASPMTDTLNPATFSEPSPATAANFDQTQLDRRPPASAHTKSDCRAQAAASSVNFTEALANGIYLNNAGLVLLHPFLPQLFTALNICEDRCIVQPERGLQLLHFLCTGQTAAPEYDLALAKVLLNQPLEQTMATLEPLSDDDQQEAMALLAAVIGHWQALRDTSPDSLRGTFLLRAGKLSRRNDGDWQLLVEQQGFDILLNQLPWGIGMIKLPWMANMLWVDWSY